MKEIISEIFEKEQLILKKIKNQDLIERHINLFGFRIEWIVWLRWIWKTTFLLQKRTKTPNSIYISCDDIVLKSVNFFNLVKEIRKAYNIKTFFIDELQFLEDWRNVLKNIYDFLDVKVIFSGSSLLSLISGSVDLSRRVLINKIFPFTFREYEKFFGNDLPSLKFDEILNNCFDIVREISSDISLIRFKEYLAHGQFWYWFEVKDEKIFYQLLLNSLRKSIYEDLPQVVDIHTSNLKNLEKLILYLANLWTSEISVNRMAKKIWINYNTCLNYLKFLEDLWWIISMSKWWTISDNLRKERKFYFSNTNILYALKSWLEKYDSFVGKVRESFFVFNLMRIKEKYWFDVYFKTHTDFVVKYKDKVYEFEVWWKKKKRSDVFVVKDDILIWNKNEIPLWIWWLVE